MTIVKNLRWVRNITPTAVSGAFVTAACQRVPQSSKSGQATVTAVFGLLEIFLRVTGQRLSMRSIWTGDLLDVSKGFIGAIHSEKFLTASLREIERVHSVWFRMVCALTKSTGREYSLPPPTTLRFWSWELCDCVRFFQTLPVDNNQLRDFEVWTVCNVHGETRRLHLDALRETLGDDFTAAFYDVVDTYFSGSARDTVEHINQVAGFLASYPGISPERLHDNEFSISLWSEFLNHYIENRIETARIDTIAVSWRNDVQTFLFRHLFQSGLASKPTTFINLPIRKVSGHPKHVVEDSTGLLYTEKLLTAIPLHLTDREAIEVLFGKIQRSIDAVLEWAEHERAKTLVAFRNRQRWEKTGNAGRVKGGSLLAHYLPSAIRNFLRVRYVRIMQTGIVVEAMKGSRYQLEASGFTSAEELNQFLNAHTLRYVRNHPPKEGLLDGKSIDDDSEDNFTHVVFNISVDVLTVYTSTLVISSDIATNQI